MTRKEYLVEAVKEMEKYARAWNFYKKSVGGTKAELNKRIKEYKKELELIKE